MSVFWPNCMLVTSIHPLGADKSKSVDVEVQMGWSFVVSCRESSSVRALAQA
jgi:hypothetical protein